MAKSRKKAPARTMVIDVPVAFGGVSIGDKTARLGVTVDRNEMKIGEADVNLCGRRLTGTVIAKPPGDQADQAALPGMADDTKLSNIFDVKGFRVSNDDISFGLTFAIKGLDVASLAHFAKRNGRLQVTEVERIPEDAEEGDPDDAFNGDGKE